MKKGQLNDYYDFFMELPSADYLNDIEIQDEYEKPNDQISHGLSDEQVSQIAIDSLSSAKLSAPRNQTNDSNTTNSNE